MTGIRKLAGWLMLAALLVAMMVTVCFWSFTQIEQTARARQEKNAVLDRAHRLLAALIDAETAHRGFLLTGDEAFLEPWFAVVEKVPGDLKQLRQEKPGQAHLETVTPVIEAKMRWLAGNIELRRANEGTRALENVRSPEGRPAMDVIRVELQAFITDVEADRDREEAEFQASLRRLYFVLVVISTLILLLGLSFALLIARQGAQRLQNEVHLVTQRSLEALAASTATLAISEEKLTVTLNSIGDAVIATDAQARVTLLNPLAETLTGWTRAEALGRPIDEVFRIISEETRLPSRVPVQDTLTHGTTHGLANHTVLLARAGTECAIADSCAPIRARGGEVVGAVLVFRDVSKERVNQQLLRDLQFYTRSLVDSNSDALVVTDVSGMITDANHPMEALTGRTHDELLGTSFQSHFTDPARAQAGVELVLAQNKVTDYELTAQSRGGARTVVSFNASTFHDRAGTLQGVFAAARDVTERNRLSLAVQEKNNELEKANLAKSEFLSSMSHELRSPLNAILGFAQLMDTDVVPPTAPQALSIGQILKAGWHLLTLINEILDLAKIESGQVPLSQEPVSLTEVLQECQSMVGPSAQLRGIELAFPGLVTPTFVSADRTRLKQVLINLLSNAIKYNRINGTVTVSCTWPTPERVRVSIADTGTGLFPAQVAQLFQAFNRLGQEGGGTEGTGIGLVVSRRLVELMGGSMGVESTVGTGSVFWFELNATEAPSLAEDGAATPGRAVTLESPSVRIRTVLYVEDNPANLLLVKQILSRLPELRLITATDGYGGIELARAARPDVILMDINLPGIGGVEAMKILRTDPATSKIKVLALSANAMPRDVARGLEAGFFRYITKPIRVTDFIESLTAALEAD